MAMIDIREEVQTIDTIVFASNGDVEQIKKSSNCVMLKDSCGEFVLVPGMDVPNLIRALQKAIELGWTE